MADISSPNTINLYDAEDKAHIFELKTIKYELQSNGTALCTLNTPSNLNALTLAQQWEMFAILDHATRDDQVRCLVWTGEGRAFGSGAALGKGSIDSSIPTELQEAMTARGMGHDGTMALKALTLAFWDFPKPSIAAINGLAVGGTANIALVNFNDLVFCAPEARFKYPFADLGFTPELGSSFMMPRAVGMARAKEIMFLGDWFDAQAAFDMGLVNAIFPLEELMSKVLEVAGRLCDKHPISLANSKRLLNREMRDKLAEALDIENKIILQTMKATGGPLGVQQWKKARQERLSKL